KEKIDSIGKLLPTVVGRLLNSHEYKESDAGHVRAPTPLA
ncbi:hypothetical protein Tco_0718119, partial [Tanacetum coccineum]